MQGANGQTRQSPHAQLGRLQRCQKITPMDSTLGDLLSVFMEALLAVADKKSPGETMKRRTFSGQVSVHDAVNRDVPPKPFSGEIRRKYIDWICPLTPWKILRPAKLPTGNCARQHFCSQIAPCLYRLSGEERVMTAHVTPEVLGE